ncbi:hypothetical protein CspeluHIS016_0200180 [Cutaneotrichosporon spelunceum]|uniref:Uncharacterized protein n=1 Tax=Cutaneotrichosporon spelunceum TaxID=1672016 RepID=A0AAD3TQI9_9TREE|nr:hypothetical protein CspeluHIS016_0200180 [Cutaneotrichosporon spelunceum]
MSTPGGTPATPAGLAPTRIDAPSDVSAPQTPAAPEEPSETPRGASAESDAHDTPTPAATPNLISHEAPALPGQTFSDIEELKEHLQDWAGDHGFAISCTSSRGGDYYTMRCKRARGGSGGCPWTMVVRRFFFAIDKNASGRLAWTTTNFTHNHPPMPRGTFAIHRRPTPEVREYIERAGERGDKPRVILNAVRRMEGCAEFDIDTVYYIVAQWRRKSRTDRVGSAGVGSGDGAGSESEPVERGPNHAPAESGRRAVHVRDVADGESGRSDVQPPDGAEINPVVDATTAGSEANPQPQPTSQETQLERVDARGRPKPWCDGCQSYIRHHGSCPREQRKRKVPGESTATYIDMGVQTEPLDIFKDPAFARQIAAILVTASENVKGRAGL